MFLLPVQRPVYFTFAASFQKWRQVIVSSIINMIMTADGKGSASPDLRNIRFQVVHTAAHSQQPGYESRVIYIQGIGNAFYFFAYLRKAVIRK